MKHLLLKIIMLLTVSSFILCGISSKSDADENISDIKFKIEELIKKAERSCKNYKIEDLKLRIGKLEKGWIPKTEKILVEKEATLKGITYKKAVSDKRKIARVIGISEREFKYKLRTYKKKVKGKKNLEFGEWLIVSFKEEITKAKQEVEKLKKAIKSNPCGSYYKSRVFSRINGIS